MRTNLDRIRIKAKQTANRTGIPIAIYNFNPFSPAYVLRDCDEKQTDRREFVEQVDPD